MLRNTFTFNCKHARKSVSDTQNIHGWLYFGSGDRYLYRDGSTVTFEISAYFRRLVFQDLFFAELTICRAWVFSAFALMIDTKRLYWSLVWILGLLALWQYNSIVYFMYYIYYGHVEFGPKLIIFFKFWNRTKIEVRSYNFAISWPTWTTFFPKSVFFSWEKFQYLAVFSLEAQFRTQLRVTQQSISIFSIST